MAAIIIGLELDAVRRSQEVDAEEKKLAAVLTSSGDAFPGSGYHPANRKTWMEGLGAKNVQLHQVVWPGTHDSATNGIGIFASRPLAECQTLSIYEQLCMGCRVLDVRVQKDGLVCHGIITGYSVDVVFGDVRRFLAETSSEVIILEIRTGSGQEDPPAFARHIIDQIGSRLIQQDDKVFSKTIAELLPAGRVICVWKPSQSAAPKPGERLWNGTYLRDDWIDTDLPLKKFESNLATLRQKNPPPSERRYFYRVENTLTPQGNNLLSLAVEPVTRRMHRFARLFISQAHSNGDKLQVFSTDFIDEDFVDACVGATKGRVDVIM